MTEVDASQNVQPIFDQDVLRIINDTAKAASISKSIQNYGVHEQQLVQFFLNFCTVSHGVKKQKYIEQLQNITNSRSSVLEIAVDDILEYFRENKEASVDATDVLPKIVQQNCSRYIRILYNAAQQVLDNLDATLDEDEESIDDEMLYEAILAGRCVGNTKTMEKSNIPVYLRATFEIRLTAPSSLTPLSVRGLKAIHTGSLISIEGIVTKLSSIKPKLTIAYYKCLDCDAELLQPVYRREFMPLFYCSSPACVANQRKGELHLIYPQCRFVKYQEARVQELPKHVPQGSIPTTLKVFLEGSLTRKLAPGMTVTMSGIAMPLSKTEQNTYSMSSTMMEMSFLVTDFVVHKQSKSEPPSKNKNQNSTERNKATEATATEEEEEEEFIQSFMNDPHLYEKLANSIAPNIHGLLDVKKTLLLQLVGAGQRRFTDGMKLRGDIHVLLMGDPGVAKSQLLGQVCRIAERANYTTGKGSSGVGLTAAVVRDSTSGEITLEGGAIVLSDHGICCIDEFDKMNEYDRTAIHEVMEQQTVSISKAGLTTTLNARTAILGAANPQYGRYDIKKTPMQNINLPAALLSRFDIQFLLLDRADTEADLRLARHVLQVHQSSNTQSETQLCYQNQFEAKTIRAIISRAQKCYPLLPRYLFNEIVQYYVDMRQRERTNLIQYEYTTPRTLLAILRLSQAMARLRFSNTIDRGDFEEALRLIYESKRSVLTEMERSRHVKRSQEEIQSDIIELIKEMDQKNSFTENWNKWLTLTTVVDLCARQGFNKKAVFKTIDAYEEIGVLRYDEEKARIQFVDSASTVGA